MALENKKLGNRLVLDGRYEEAVGKYSELIMQTREMQKEGEGGVVWKSEDKRTVRILVATAYLNLAQCFLKTEKYEHCINCATRALQGDEDPPNPEHDVLEPNQKAKAHYRRAMARPSHLVEEKLKDCELGLAEHAGNTEMRQLRQQLKDELKKAARKSGMAKGFLARGEIVADVVNAPDTQDAEEQRATETFDSVADDLRDMCIDDPEKFKQLKEKLRQMCEENDALPPKDWS
eukprot:GEMP01069358.1.p1 GENE.GEMP01069358.1~~GEMP01069358.1.p1  ORF type:complete len:234 (+),score=65.26 GEMP01069358.1:196-897(+)